ncbi:putative leader peptide [Streptomyces sp. NPDC048219]
MRPPAVHRCGCAVLVARRHVDLCRQSGAVCR